MLSHSNVLLKKKFFFNKDKNNYNYKTNQHTNQKRQLDKDKDMLIVKCKTVKRFSKHILHKPILSYTLTMAITKISRVPLGCNYYAENWIVRKWFCFYFPFVSFESIWGHVYGGQGNPWTLLSQVSTYGILFKPWALQGDSKEQVNYEK